jgi:phage shock protein PspC (stress-responsive transcriptional regulator)
MKILGRELYRSNKDRRIAGVCAGIAEFLNTDPSFVRITWAFSSILFGTSIFIYILAWMAIPQRPNKNEDSFKGRTIIIE